MSIREVQGRLPVKSRFGGSHTLVVLGILLSVLALSFVDNMEVIPLFAPLLASPLFPFMHETHDLLAIGVVLYTAYKYGYRIGVAAILVYFVAHIPYIIFQFLGNAPEIARIISIGFITILGIRLISSLRNDKRAWQLTFDSITEMVAIIDKGFRLVKVNKAFADAFKMKPEELRGKLCYGVVHESNKPRPDCPVKHTLQTKKSGKSDFFEPRLGMDLEVITSPIFDERGSTTSVVFVSRDVTERKKMQIQLIAQDRLATIGQMVSGVAHEINNPLTSVIGFSDLLLQRDLPSDVKGDLKIVNDEAHRTSKIVKGLLTFARKQPEKKEPVDINAQVKIIIELSKHRHKINNIQVNTDYAEDLPQITANGSQLQQVFLNIVMNAEQAMLEAHGKGNLTISSERVGDIVKTRFTDDGPGISPENLGKLFTPFFTTKEVGKGTGLGLSICHGIITEHGGRIYAESEPGKGATFIIELPVIDTAPGQETAE